MKVIALSGVAIALVIGVSTVTAPLVMQDESPDTEKAQVFKKGTVEVNESRSNAVPTQAPEVTPEVTPEVVVQPSPSSTPEAPAPTQPAKPTFNSIDDMMVYLNIPAGERQFANMAMYPTMWQKSGFTRSPQCFESSFTLLKCLNEYVLGKYGNWTAMMDARRANSDNRW